LRAGEDKFDCLKVEKSKSESCLSHT